MRYTLTLVASVTLGVVAGVAEAGAEGGPVPTAFVAATVNE